MTTKLAFIGDSFCREGQCIQTDTFVKLLKKHYQSTISIVVQGRMGDGSLQAKIEDIDLAVSNGADIIFVFYEPQDQKVTEVYQEEQKILYQKLQNVPARVWHFQDKQSQNLKCKQPVDFEIMNYPHDWFPEYRHCVPTEVSDNGVDAAGNRKIARTLIRIIDEHKQSLASN